MSLIRRARIAFALASEISTIPCCKCDGPVIEFSVPNAVWNTVVRRDGPETDQEYLCKDCYIAIVSDYIGRSKGDK